MGKDVVAKMIEFNLKSIVVGKLESIILTFSFVLLWQEKWSGSSGAGCLCDSVICQKSTWAPLWKRRLDKETLETVVRGHKFARNFAKSLPGRRKHLFNMYPIIFMYEHLENVASFKITWFRLLTNSDPTMSNLSKQMHVWKSLLFTRSHICMFILTKKKPNVSLLIYLFRGVFLW